MNEFQKDFQKLFTILSRKNSSWNVWNDFLTLSAISIANVVNTPEREQREDEYCAIIRRYEKEELEVFPKMLALVTMALEENPEQDFLGSLYHFFHLNQNQKGQYFTPYYICAFMSNIHFTSINKMSFQKKGYISVNDPACGSGAMLLAFANEAKKKGINYQQNMLFVAQDIDLTACMMCYIQLSLLGCSAIIIIGDSLGRPGFHPENDIWCTPFYHLNQWRFRENKQDETEIGFFKDNQVAIKELIEEAGGQLTISFEQVS